MVQPHLAGQHLGHDLPYRYVGEPLGEDTVPVIEDREGDDDVSGGEAAERPVIGQHAEVVKHVEYLRIAAWPVGCRQPADEHHLETGYSADSHGADVGVG